MRYLAILVLLSLAQVQTGAASAADVILQPIARVTNDRNADLQSLGVLLDAGQVVGLRFDTIHGADPHESNFSLDEMKAGAVLDGDARHQAIVLRGSIDSTVGNADLTVTYLANGLFGTHKDCQARIVRDQRGQWHIVNIYDHERVDHLVVETWTFGISTIGGICPR